ncbi:hypothetical protein [Congregibacter sp.]|uniref:hypothetical protein n=1 Tax=Congregibacter sp. TaxID=2744308 RepID=UPI00385E2FB9
MRTAKPQLLAPPKPKTSTAAMAEEVEGLQEKSPAVDSAVVTKPRESVDESSLSRPTFNDLDLSLAEVEPSATAPLRSPRSSTVFDPQLLSTLNVYGERSGAYSSPVPVEEGPPGSFVGGRWQSFLKIGKLCFEVIEADPFDSLSTDQWFPRDCS